MTLRNEAKTTTATGGSYAAEESYFGCEFEIRWDIPDQTKLCHLQIISRPTTWGPDEVTDDNGDVRFDLQGEFEVIAFLEAMHKAASSMPPRFRMALLGGVDIRCGGDNDEDDDEI